MTPPSVGHVEFLQRLIKSEETAEVFLQDFPCAIRQALAMPLAEPGMSWVNTMRSVYTLAAVGVEVIAIAHLMNSHRERLLAISGGALEVVPTVEVEPEDFDFKGNLNGEV